MSQSRQTATKKSKTVKKTISLKTKTKQKTKPNPDKITRISKEYQPPGKDFFLFWR
jgi:hypothetical protein